MKKLLRHIHEHSADGLDTSLIVGAGTGSQLGDWRQLGCRQLLLAEAHPRLADELGRRLRHDQGEHLLAVAVTGDEQPVATLQALNNLAYSSLNQAADLFTYYPNLRRDEALQVPARSLEAIVAEQALDGRQPHALLIAAPGQALQLLQATPAAALHTFSWVIIECSSEPLYQNDASDSEIIAWMDSIGFELVTDNPDAIFPQSQLLFERNATRLAQHRLHSEVAQLRSQSSFVEQNSQQQLQALEQQLQQRDATLLELTGLANEQKQQLDDLISENARLFSACEAMEAQQAELLQALQEQTGQANARQAQIDAIGNERDQLASAGEALGQQRAALTTAYDQQASQIGDLQAELATLTSRNSELALINEALENQRAELAGACQMQTQFADERQARADALSATASELASERDALAKGNARLTETCDAQTRSAGEYKAHLDKVSEQRDQLQKALAEHKDTLEANQGYVHTLEREAVEYQHRQRLLEEELVKSEAQLELIKDLLLREPGL
ncbi:hypothetical protein A3L25_007185 [Pseudomonas putida]|uniref:Uncharacterized protein n=1 Tax=Pseudomonas putida TaxID=303 RepID=A0AAP9MY77_PSEPU|nr:hypothetical protein [Pseudomonas putida]QJQ09218.1 hypothetical protein A3L25_007185 [Pseudomonas putida]